MPSRTAHAGVVTWDLQPTRSARWTPSPVRLRVASPPPDDCSPRCQNPRRTDNCLQHQSRGHAAHMSNVPNLTLNDGTKIPQLGFGVFQIEPDETASAVRTA